MDAIEWSLAPPRMADSDNNLTRRWPAAPSSGTRRGQPHWTDSHGVHLSSITVCTVRTIVARSVAGDSSSSGGQTSDRQSHLAWPGIGTGRDLAQFSLTAMPATPTAAMRSPEQPIQIPAHRWNLAFSSRDATWVGSSPNMS